MAWTKVGIYEDDVPSRRLKYLVRWYSAIDFDGKRKRNSVSFASREEAEIFREHLIGPGGGRDENTKDWKIAGFLLSCPNGLKRNVTYIRYERIVEWLQRYVQEQHEEIANHRKLMRYSRKAHRQIQICSALLKAIRRVNEDRGDAEARVHLLHLLERCAR